MTQQATCHQSHEELGNFKMLIIIQQSKPIHKQWTVKRIKTGSAVTQLTKLCFKNQAVCFMKYLIQQKSTILYLLFGVIIFMVIFCFTWTLENLGNAEKEAVMFY